MERRIKVKQGLHTRSKSFSEESVNSLGNHQVHRQATYDDSQTRKMEVDEDQGVWMDSFSTWKMKRMRATSTERDRKAERDEVEETQEKLKRKKSKTFREIVEEKQRREKALQSGKVDLQNLGVGEITSILADLPSTNLDSDNEPEIQTPPPVVEERMQPRLERQEREEKTEEPDFNKGPIRRSNTLPTYRNAQDGSVKRAPPPVKPKPRSRSGSLYDRNNSVEQNFIEPEIYTTTDSRSTYSAPPPSQRPAPEIITATSTMNTYTAPPPAARPKSPPTMRPKSPPTMRPKSPPTMRPKTATNISMREPEPVDKPLGFHEKLSKARQYEKEAEDAEQKAKEAARKPYKPKQSSIFAKIRAFDTGEAFKKGPEEESVPKVEEKKKTDIEVDDYEDQVIIMSQKARSSRGFGFQTSGGYDERKPLVVSSVSKGSVADYSDLQVGDEILSINKESTRKFNQEDVLQCLSQSILTGKLTCKVRRYPDGKPPEKTAIKEPVIQRSNPSRQESAPPPVHSQPPARQPVRTAQPPVERVTVPPKEDPVQVDVVLRPGPTKNALARARRMLDELEIDDKEDESLESSSKSSDIVEPSSSVPPTNRQSNKPSSYSSSQPIKSNGYLPHGRDGNSMDEESISSEDSRQPTQRHRPNLQSQGRIIRHTPTSSLDESSSQDFPAVPSFRSVSAPKPYQPRAPEPYKPSSQNEPSYGRSDLNQRRSEFFPDEEDNDKPLDEMNSLWKQVEEPVVAKDEETSEMMPMYRPVKPSTAHRRPFNREEERKRLERWNEEQDRRRQEKYQLEQQRLFEEQERTLQAAAEEVQKKREEEERNLEERRRSIQKQQEELRQIRQRQMEEEENRRKARLEQERREREEAERERKETEERREKERAEEERRRKELAEREKLLREAAEKERLAREKEEEERRKTEQLKREREQREKEAQEKIRKQQEEYAKMLKEREKERIEQQRMQAEAEQKRQEEEEAERERQEIEKWRLENEEREKAAKLKAEQGRAVQEETQRRLEAEERERIRAEERERMRREWEEERKQYLEQLQQQKEQLQKEREEMAKRQEEEKKKLQMEMNRIKKERELEQKNTPIIELPVSKMTNGGDVMSAPNQQLGTSHSPRTRGSPQNGGSPRNGHSPRTVSPGTQRLKDNNQKNMLPERDHPQSHSNMSQYKDPNIPVSQHWLIEEAERRRRAEEQGIDRKLPPDVVIPPQNDIQVPQKSLHTRHPNPYPKGFDPEIPTRLPAQRKQQSQEAPASTNAVQRRLRKPEAEAEHQRKLQNRRSLPDLTGGRDNAIPSSRNPNGPQYGSGQATESPISRSSDRGQHSIPGQGSAFQEPNKNIPSNQSISGKLQCCNCGKPLGRGAAMIIESLGLHYHVECFRCCVCNIRLGNGTKGADVRIRASQLHCQNCYSNEAGFQFTEV